MLAGLAVALICLLVLALVFVVLWVLFCLTLQRTQTEVRPRNRLIPPGLVWLHLLHIGQIIPFAGSFVSLAAYVWDLIMVLKLSGSLEREFRQRGEPPTGAGYGKVVGLVWCTSGIALALLNVVFTFINRAAPANQELLIGMFVIFLALWLAGLVCWIIYWVQMAGYGRRLRETGSRYRTGSIEEDYDDDFRGPLREPSDDHDFDDDFDRPRRRRPREEDEDDYDDRRDRRRRRDDD